MDGVCACTGFLESVSVLELMVNRVSLLNGFIALLVSERAEGIASQL